MHSFVMEVIIRPSGPCFDGFCCTLTCINPFPLRMLDSDQLLIPFLPELQNKGDAKNHVWWSSCLMYTGRLRR